MNIKEVKITGTVPWNFGQAPIEGLEPGMSDEDAALLWRWFQMPLTELHITFETRGMDRLPFRVEGYSSTAIKGINHMLHVLVKNGAIIEVARARDTEDPATPDWFQLEPKPWEPIRAPSAEEIIETMEDSGVDLG